MQEAKHVLIGSAEARDWRSWADFEQTIVDKAIDQWSKRWAFIPSIPNIIMPRPHRAETLSDDFV